jgi:hypothetical protein
MVLKITFQLNDQQSYATLHSISTIVITISKPSQVIGKCANQRINKMDHVGLSHNLKSQVFCAIIKVNHLIFYNLIINDNNNVTRFLN